MYKFVCGGDEIKLWCEAKTIDDTVQVDMKREHGRIVYGVSAEVVIATRLRYRER